MPVLDQHQQVIADAVPPLLGGLEQPIHLGGVEDVEEVLGPLMAVGCRCSRLALMVSRATPSPAESVVGTSTARCCPLPSGRSRCNTKAVPISAVGAAGPAMRRFGRMPNSGSSRLRWMLRADQCIWSGTPTAVRSRSMPRRATRSGLPSHPDRAGRLNPDRAGRLSSAAACG